MRFATYNVEWFSGLFDNNKPLFTDDWSSRRDVTKSRQLHAIANVFKAIDADCVLVVEAPDSNANNSTEASLLAFSKHFGLRLNAVLTGFMNDTQQEIALFYDNRKMSAAHDPQGGNDPNDKAPRFDGKFHKDIDIDGEPEVHVFSKPPLEAEVTLKSGQIFRMLGVHIKSKAPHGAKNHDDEVRISIDNRRKQLAQTLWLRRRVDAHLMAGDDVIVLGDFNDGPGLDTYEKLFGHSSVEVVLGTDVGETMSLFDPHASARLNLRDNWSPSTARFYLHHRKTYLNALLDFIMVSKEVRALEPKWKIWHPFDDHACFDKEEFRSSLLDASDHFPVTLDLDI